MPVVAAPRLIRTADVAAFYGVDSGTVRRGVGDGRRPYVDGYVGKVGGFHCWDLNRMIELSADTACQVCGAPGGLIRMCPEHAVEFLSAWDRAESSRHALLRFVALCRWVSERWAHVSFVAGLDPWADVCAGPRCDRFALDGPLCSGCLRRLRLELGEGIEL